MEWNKDTALRDKELAEKRLLQMDLGSARLLAKKAQDLYPNLDGLPQLLATIDVYISAEKRVNGEVDWYRVLGAQPFSDDDTIRKCYRKLALTLHPDKNKSAGADGAFNLISQAWSLLSDKAKRTTYDQKYKLWAGIYQRIPGGKPPASASQNGLFNTVNTANWKDRDDRSATCPNPTPIPPATLKHTFWTMCSSCRTQFEYLTVYMNLNLQCTSCKKSFFAFEVPPPSVYTNASSTSRISQMRQHNFNSTILERNCHVPGRTPMSTVNSSLGSGPFSMPGRISSIRTSASTAAEAPGVFRMSSENLKRRREDSTSVTREEAHFGKTHAFERTFASSAFQSSCFGSNPVLKGDGSRKKRCTDEPKVDIDRRDMETETASQKGINLANGFGSQNNSFDTGKVNAAGNYRRNQLQIRNILMEKARREIRKKLDELNAKKLDELNASSVSKNLNKSKNTDTGVGGKDKERAVNGVKPGAQELVDSETIDKKCFSADSEVPDSLSMSVPDPDFHDFDGDRIENTFGEDQVWAAYDNDDGMPRYYALIHSVISNNPFKMRISWLNSKTNDEFAPIKWVGSGFPKTTGDFRIGKREIYSTLNSFSHRVEWTKGSRGVIHIYPKKGDVWALYRNWSLDWNEFTEDEIIHKYDMVEVLEDYSEEQGVNVAPLVKVAGFKTVFCQNADPSKIRNIPKAEMFRFSHQVPSYMLTGQEGQNAPKGFLELDPASTPMELLQAEAPKQEMEMTVESSLKDELRREENPREDGLVEKGQRTKEEDSAGDVPTKEVAEAPAKKANRPEIFFVYKRRRTKEKSAL